MAITLRLMSGRIARGAIAGVCLLALFSAACEQKPAQVKPIKPTAGPVEAAPSEESAPTPEPTPAPEPAPTPAPTPDAPPAEVTFTVAHHPEADLRLVTYNILWNTIFEEESVEGAAKFARVVRALDPDILAVQEIGLPAWKREQDPNARDWSAEDVTRVMNKVAPQPGGATWHVFQAFDNVIISKYPLKMTAEETVPPGERKQALALIDLPDDRFAVDFYLLNNHYKCCGGEQNDPRRQQQSDSIIAWLRDAREAGGEIDLPKGTPFAVVGDLNIVGTFQPVQTLIDGNISDEDIYGADGAPDWDGTPLTDLHPRHNGVGPDDYTWRDDNSEWKPGRLDYIIFTDSVLEPMRQFVLNTTTLSDADLKAAGLEKFDITVDDVGKEFDHMPLVVDFRVRPLVSE